MSVANEKKILILAGPNGAGKTTFAEEFLPHEANCPEFVNADLIAKGISPFQPERAAIAAGRIMLARMDELTASGESFAFETNLSSHGHTGRIKAWRKLGYCVKLYFLKLPNPEFAIQRVAHRVEMGGHHVPNDVVRRRFNRGWKFLKEIYIPIVDEWAIYDAAQNPPVLLETGSST